MKPVGKTTSLEIVPIAIEPKAKKKKELAENFQVRINQYHDTNTTFLLG